MPLANQLQAYANAVNARLDLLLPPPTSVPIELHEAMRYSCLANGKRLRPALCLASAEAVGAPALAVLDAACAVEMVHCFSLIHDDLPAIDDDDLRRGQPTCHKRFGEAIAILAGDALFSLAFEVLANSKFQIPNSKIQNPVLRAVQVLTRATGSDGLVGGEVVDVLSEGVPIDANQLEYIHSRKTGALIGASCEIGAIMGGGTERQVAALAEFGRTIGLAFQIVDDILNETSDSIKLGKSVGSDRERSKATYTKRFGLLEARRLAESTVARAKAGLAGVPSESLLHGLADFTVQRLN